MENLINIYNEQELYFFGYGIGVISKAYDIVITKKENDAVTAQFTISKNDINYSKLKEGRFIKLDNTIFIIRRLEEVLTFDKMEVIVSCEHILFELLDEFIPFLSKQKAEPFNILSEILDGTRFTPKTDMTERVNLQVTRGSKLKCIDELCKNIAGIRLCSNLPNGDGKFTVELVDTNKSRNLGTLIHNRKNRKSIKRTIDGSKVITRLYPFGAEDLTIQEAVNSNGLMYIDSTRINEYRRPKEVGVVFDNINDADTLYDSGKKYLELNENPIVTYEVEMTVLNDLLNLKKQVEIGDTITVIDEELGEGGVTIQSRVTEINKYLDDKNKPLVVSLETIVNSADKLIADMLNTQETDTGIRKGNVWTEFITLPFSNETITVIFGMQYATKPVINCHVIGEEALLPIVKYVFKTDSENNITKFTGCTIDIPNGTGEEVCLQAMGRI